MAAPGRLVFDYEKMRTKRRPRAAILREPGHPEACVAFPFLVFAPLDTAPQPRHSIDVGELIRVEEHAAEDGEAAGFDEGLGGGRFGGSWLAAEGDLEGAGHL